MKKSQKKVPNHTVSGKKQEQALIKRSVPCVLERFRKENTAILFMYFKSCFY